MASEQATEARVDTSESVLQVKVGRVTIDVPRSLGYFGGLGVAVGVGLVEPPLALFIAAVPAFKALTNSALPWAVRTLGEVAEGVSRPVGSDAEGVVRLEDQGTPTTKVITIP